MAPSSASMITRPTDIGSPLRETWQECRACINQSVDDDPQYDVEGQLRHADTGIGLRCGGAALGCLGDRHAENGAHAGQQKKGENIYEIEACKNEPVSLPVRGNEPLP